MTAVILVGGEGTRLRPLTLKCPKNVVPLAGRPFLHLPLELLRRHGIRDVVLAIGYMPAMIKKAVGDGKRLGLRVQYVTEREPLGTGGAIRNARRLIHGPAVVLNGDVLTDLDLSKVIHEHRARKAVATIVLTRVEDPSAYGLVDIAKDGRVRRFMEKPSADEIKRTGLDTVNAGTYVLEPSAIDMIPPGVNHSVERGLFPRLVQQGAPIFAYVSDAYWLDIGTPEKYRQAHGDILHGKVRFEPGPRKKGNLWLGARLRLHPGAVLEGPLVIGDGTRIDADAQIGSLTAIGRNCRIGARAEISGSVLWDGVVIGEGAHVKDAILGHGCHIGDHARISPGTVLGDDAFVPRHSRL